MARLSSTDPVTFRLTADGDIDVTKGRTTLIAGVEGFAQGVKSRLELVRGQWFLDRRAGVPMLENDYVTSREAILGQPYAPQKLRRAVNEQFLRTPGASRLTEYAATFDGRTRRASVKARGKCVFADTGVQDTGEIVRGVG
jgi:hypothetical protein